MKRVTFAFLVCTMVVILAGAYVYADEIIETPDVKIVIDGKTITYEDIPLSLNQRTLLPLREVLVNLGVPNDDEHIRWDGEEKSVTVYKDSIKIYLKIGSNIAYVNDEPVILDTMPVGYKNQRVYIPARFVSQSLGKTVIWDGATKTVLIRDENEFELIRDIFKKAEDALDSVGKFKAETTMAFKIDKEGQDESFYANMMSEIDKENKIMYLTADIPIFKTNMSFESYYKDNTVYTKDSFTGKWDKKVLTDKEYNDLFSENMNSATFKANDAVYAGLVLYDSADSDNYILRGNVLPRQYLDIFNAYNTSKSSCTLNRYFLEIIIDKKTNLISKVYAELGGTMSNSLFSEFESQVTSVYSSFNEDFEIKVPDGI
jgi:hypothetical protein